MHTLTQLRQWCQDKNIPSISPETEQIISQILQTIRPKYCCEIWAAAGYSSTMIANTIQARGWQIYSFEVAHNAYTWSLTHTKPITNLTIYPRSPLDINLDTLLPKKYDFVFIDGQKAQYNQYLMKIQSLLHKESVIVCDDVIKFQNKLTPLYWYLQKMQIFYEILRTEVDDGIMLIGEKSLIKAIVDRIKSKNKK